MNVLLEIGGVRFISADAATAAKVADLLGTMDRVTERYHCGKETEYVLVKSGDRYSHRIVIGSLDSRRVFITEDDFQAWSDQQPKRDEGGEP